MHTHALDNESKKGMHLLSEMLGVCHWVKGVRNE